MYLPPELPKAQVLITVKTYPQPSKKYTELVCTGGLLDGEKWIRIYPVPFRFLQNDKMYPKYGRVELDLVRNTRDFRTETYRMRHGIDEEIRLIDKIDTKNNWAERKKYVLKEVFDSMEELIRLAKGPEKKSLATIKPAEIVEFVIEEVAREWKESWMSQSKQGDIFELDKRTKGGQEVVRKLPYKYHYRLLFKGDKKPRKLKIEDWEIGALYWNCLKRAEGDEHKANEMVRKKYLDEFTEKKDLYLFVGTTLQYHNVAPNPFMVIGVFYPPKSRGKDKQISMF